MAFDPDEQLDEIGKRLVRELQDNARLSYSELTRRSSAIRSRRSSG